MFIFIVCCVDISIFGNTLLSILVFTLDFVCLQYYIWSSFLYVIIQLYLCIFPYSVICIYSILPVGRYPASSSHTSLEKMPYMEGGPPYTLCSTT